MSDTKISDSDFLDAAERGDSDAIEAALGAGTKADTADAYGNTALMKAAARGQRDVVRRLIEAGANADHKNKFGLGPRNWAAWAQNDKQIRALLG